MKGGYPLGEEMRRDRGKDRERFTA